MELIENFGGLSQPNPLPFKARVHGRRQLVATLRPKPENNSRFPKAMLRTLNIQLEVESGRLSGLAVETNFGEGAAWIFDRGHGADHTPHPSQAHISFPESGVAAGELLSFSLPVGHPPVSEVRIFATAHEPAAIDAELSWDPESH